jgi:glycosyltransferase involved in cell wall biosynthesis
LNILYFTPFPSHPSNHGNQATIQQFARRFQSFGHKVHFALLHGNLYTRQDEQAMSDAWDSFDILPNSHPLGADGSAIPFDGWYEYGLGKNIRVLCARYDIDVVFCHYIFQSKLLEFVPSYVLKVIDTHDKMADRYEMLRSNGQPLEFFSCTSQEEGAYLRRADIVVARRDEEARYFNSVTGRNTAIVIPYFEDPQFRDKTFNKLRHVGIVASANRINLACVQEFLEAIDRRLAGTFCPFIVNIAGQVKDMVPDLPAAKAAVFQKPWVRLHGFVPDIGEFYDEMDLVVSPVTIGTGINVKTVQAMAYGMPLLTTACGSKGIETGDPMHCHSDLDALAESLMTICKNRSAVRRLAALSRKRYDRFYETGMNAMRGLFQHQKLLSGELGVCKPGIDEPKHAKMDSRMGFDSMTVLQRRGIHSRRRDIA